MKITNSNYCATIVKIYDTNHLSGCDNLIGVSMFGYNIITQKNIDLDKLYILFTAESQINPEFLSENNLYNSSSLNKDTTKRGYISNSGRVRAIKLRGHPSNALLIPLEYLIKFKNLKIDFKEGDSFNLIGNFELVKKYELPIKENSTINKTKGNIKKYERIDLKNFPEHFDTEHFKKNEFKYFYDDTVIITQKLHGTSVRLGNVKVKIKQTFIDFILGRQRFEYDYLAGSRRVIKDLKYNEFKSGSKDIYNIVLEEIKYKIPKDVIIYGEIIGYDGLSPIQKGYTYGCMPGQHKLIVYRIVSINSDGIIIDWSRGAIKEWCNNNNILYVTELGAGIKIEISFSFYLDKNYSKEGWSNAFPVNINMVDEGICVRKEGFTPYVTKYKSPLFLEYETKLLDEGVKIYS